MRMTPYLNFPGTCAEAFRFYARVLGGKLEMQTHGESPFADQVEPEWRDLVLHARLEVGDAVLMGSDMPPDQTAQPQGLYIALIVETAEDAERIFAEFSEDGSVTMPLQQAFWAARFGMLVDRFGTPWMVSTEQPAEEPAAAGGA